MNILFRKESPFKPADYLEAELNGDRINDSKTDLSGRFSSNLVGLQSKIERDSKREKYKADDELLQYLSGIGDPGLSSEISLASSKEEVEKLLKEARNWGDKYPNGKIITDVVKKRKDEDSESVQKLRKIKGLTKDQYETALIRLGADSEKVEDVPNWEKTHKKIMRIVESIPDSVMKKGKKNALLYKLTSADKSGTINALRTHYESMPAVELSQIENILGLDGSYKSEDPDSNSIPLKKEKSVDEKGESNLDIVAEEENSKKSFGENYHRRERGYPTTIDLIDNSDMKDMDGTFARRAEKFYFEGDIGNALASVEWIKDVNIQSQTIHNIIVECQKNQDVYNIKKFIGKLKDTEYKEKLTNWLNSEMKLVVDPMEPRVKEGEMTSTKPEPVSPYGDTVPEAVPEVVPEMDLPLNDSKPSTVDAGEVVLDNGDVATEEPKVEAEKVPESVVVNEKTENKSEASLNREAIQAELDKARDDYAREYIDWEYKTRHSKTMFKKTMASLGSVVKTMPDKFSLKTTALEDALDEYNKAKEKAGEVGLVSENKTLLSERFNLDDRMQFYREEKEAEYKKEKEEGKKKDGVFETRNVAETIKKGLAKWPKIPQRAKVAVSAVLLTGGMISTVGDISNGFDGLRADRVVAGDTNRKGNEDIPDLSGTVPEKGVVNPSFEIKTPEAIRPVEVQVSSKGFIKTLENLQEEIVKVYVSEDKIPEEIKKTLINKSAVELAKQFEFYNPENNESAIGIKGETIGLDTYGNLVYHYVDGSSKIIFDTKTGLTQDFGGKMKADTVSAEVVENNVTEKIPYKDSFIEVVKYDGGNEVIKYNDQEIAKSYDLNGEKSFALEDKYQDGIKFAEIRGAFSEYLKNNPPKNLALPEPISFAGGTIYLVRDTVLVNKISAILNGKLIGTADLTERVKKIKPLKSLKGGWFQADNMYEIACKEGTKVLPRISVV